MYMYYLLNKFSLSTIKMAILDIWIHVRFLFILISFWIFIVLSWTHFTKVVALIKVFMTFLKTNSTVVCFYFIHFDWYYIFKYMVSPNAEVIRIHNNKHESSYLFYCVLFALFANISLGLSEYGHRWHFRYKYARLK